MKPLLVGEDNPYGSDPRYALWCAPRHSAGGRLCYDILGVKDQVDYVRKFDRANLCLGKWSAKEAGHRADELQKSHRTLILLGAKVCSRFGYNFEPFTIKRKLTSPFVETLCGVTHDEWTFVLLPHPSGRNRLWNQPGAVDRARTVLRQAGVLQEGA